MATQTKATRPPRKMAKSKKQVIPSNGDGLRIPIAWIEVVTNHRKQFNQIKLQQMAESMKVDDVIQPLVVKTTADPQVFELVAGERRLRAAELAGLDDVPVVIKELDDAAKSRVRLSENFFREDLNAIEKAEAFLDVRQANGWSQRELADHYPDELSQGQIANAERLLNLPEVWQRRVISQEITTKQARELAAWHDLPAVLQEMEAELKDEELPLPQETWDRILKCVLRDCSRPLSGQFWRENKQGFGGRQVKVALTKKEKEREDLVVREVPTWNGKEKRAFHLPLWEEFQAAGEERRAKRQRQQQEKQNGPAASTKKKLTSAEKQKKAQQQKEQWEKKLTRYYFAWLQRTLLTELESLVTMSEPIWSKVVIWFAVQPGPERRGQELKEVLKQCGGKERSFGQSWYRRPDAWGSMDTLNGVALCEEVMQRACLQWLSHPFGYNADVKPHMLQGLANELDVSLESHWECDREFLELHTKEQLGALAKEWKTNIFLGKRQDVIDALLNHANEMAEADKPLKPSKDLVKIAKKPVAL